MHRKGCRMMEIKKGWCWGHTLGIGENRKVEHRSVEDRTEDKNSFPVVM